jgi:adenine-specific DNA-methyltransferase
MTCISATDQAGDPLSNLKAVRTRVARAAQSANHGTDARRKQKAKGVFYTPPALAGVLADWALEPLPKRILEPAFGDGVFIRAAQAALQRSGVRNPSQRLFGVDIDRHSLQRVRDSGFEPTPGHLVCRDLLTTDAEDLGGRFDAIVGNPPYIRHHLLPKALARRGRKTAKELGVALNGRSDAWAYFCAHLLGFLSDDGRLALVLPGSALQADYAAPLLDALTADKGEVQLIRIGELLFADAQERTVVLLIDRTSAGVGKIKQRQRADVSSLRQALKYKARRGSRRREHGGDGDLNPEAARDQQASDGLRLTAPWGLTNPEADLYRSVCADESVSRLGDVVTIRIGVVTGANGFFVLTENQISALGEGARSKAIVSRGGWLGRPRWRAADQRRVAHRPSRLLLLTGTEKPSGRLRAKIEQAEDQALNLRHHCSRREPWYAITDASSPQMFLPYMGSRPPRIVINDAKATCTNSVHRVQLKPSSRCSAARVAAASWSTLYALSAELWGRSYGGGVLKLEPGRTAKMSVAIPRYSDVLMEISEAVETWGFEAGRKIADERLLVDGVGLSTNELEVLQRAAQRLADRR